MIRQRNGNMRLNFQRAVESAQWWADIDSRPVNVWKTQGGYVAHWWYGDHVPEGGEYIAKTVHPQKRGDA